VIKCNCISSNQFVFLLIQICCQIGYDYQTCKGYICRDLGAAMIMAMREG